MHRVVCVVVRATTLGAFWGAVLVGCMAAPRSSSVSQDAETQHIEAKGSRVDGLLEAENRRSIADVTDDDLGNHDPRVRRQAARALSRSGNPLAVAKLLAILPDEDAEVVAFSAYGLGFFCRASGVDPGIVVGALTARAMGALPAVARLDPAFAIARALGHCASDDAEKTLAAWLSVPSMASFAALGLGDIASRKKDLTEATQMALLAAAEGADAREPSAEALYPFSRLEHPHHAAASRLREIATRHLGTALPTRIFAVRALARAGSPSIAALVRVLSAPMGFTPSEKSKPREVWPSWDPRGRTRSSEPSWRWCPRTMRFRSRPWAPLRLAPSWSPSSRSSAARERAKKRSSSWRTSLRLTARPRSFLAASRG